MLSLLATLRFKMSDGTHQLNLDASVKKHVVHFTPHRQTDKPTKIDLNVTVTKNKDSRPIVVEFYVHQNILNNLSFVDDKVSDGAQSVQTSNHNIHVSHGVGVNYGSSVMTFGDDSFTIESLKDKTTSVIVHGNVGGNVHSEHGDIQVQTAQNVQTNHGKINVTHLHGDVHSKFGNITIQNKK